MSNIVNPFVDEVRHTYESQILYKKNVSFQYPTAAPYFVTSVQTAQTTAGLCLTLIYSYWVLYFI